VEATSALVALREACFAEDNQIGCLVDEQTTAELEAAEAAVIEALAAAATEATTAGATDEACRDPLTAAGSKLPFERTELLRRYGFIDGQLEGFGTATANAMALNHTEHYFALLRESASEPGLMVGAALGACRVALDADAPLLAAAVEYVRRATTMGLEVGYGSWGLNYCLGSTRTADERAECVTELGGSIELQEALDAFQPSFADLMDAPGYADLSGTCSAAFASSYERLAADGATVAGLYADAQALPAAAQPGEAASTAIWDATFPLIDASLPDREAPLEESTVLTCLDEIAASGA